MSLTAICSRWALTIGPLALALWQPWAQLAMDFLVIGPRVLPFISVKRRVTMHCHTHVSFALNCFELRIGPF